MAKVDPIIAVKNVEASSAWYRAVFNCKSLRGGKEFDVLTLHNNEVFICLHTWGAHEHPTMKDPSVTAGNGLILYFRTNDMESIRKNAERVGAIVAEDIHLNENSTKREFSVVDPDGYYWTITEYHEYDG